MTATDIFEKFPPPEFEETPAGERFHAQSERAFTIDTAEKADWLLRKLANIDAEQQRVSAQAAKIVAQLDADRARLLNLYEGELVDFTRRTLAEQGRGRRTLHLLQGSIALRLVPASVRVSDPFAALAYVRQHAPDLVRRTEQLDSQAFQQLAAKRLQASGELLPGVESTPARETHRITFGGKT